MNGTDLRGSSDTPGGQTLNVYRRETTELMALSITHVSVPSCLTKPCDFEPQLPSYSVVFGTFLKI
jgi:hypothetical protein